MFNLQGGADSTSWSVKRLFFFFCRFVFVFKKKKTSLRSMRRLVSIQENKGLENELHCWAWVHKDRTRDGGTYFKEWFIRNIYLNGNWNVNMPLNSQIKVNKWQIFKKSHYLVLTCHKHLFLTELVIFWASIVTF